MNTTAGEGDDDTVILEIDSGDVRRRHHLPSVGRRSLPCGFRLDRVHRAHQHPFSERTAIKLSRGRRSWNRSDSLRHFQSSQFTRAWCDHSNLNAIFLTSLCTVVVPGRSRHDIISDLGGSALSALASAALTDPSEMPIPLALSYFLP